MWDENQKTVKSIVNFAGIGLHSGREVKLTLLPAKSDTGVIFRRIDLDKNNEIIANFKNVCFARLCTKIQNKFGVSISTIEHLMGAFYICGVDNVVVNVDGPEVPAMDGSAKDFVHGIKDSGLKILNKKREFIKITKKIELKQNDKYISIEPSDNFFTVKFTLGYKNSLIKTQSNKASFQEKDLENIYSARTFCLYEDIRKIKDLGLAKGGSLENAVVVKGNEVFNGKGLRSKNEFVNHKILDLVGDFMLAGKRVIGSINCICGGHSLTNDFLRQVLSNKNNFTTIKNQNSSLNIGKISPVQKGLVVNA
jgi:UDP-3-O-[3-hydroxymyristoyl] N-acetylglucosamine deacetylase